MARRMSILALSRRLWSVLPVLIIPILAGAGAASAADCVRYEDQFRRVGFRSTSFDASGILIDESAGIAYVCGYHLVSPTSSSLAGDLEVYGIGQPGDPDFLAHLEFPARVDALALEGGHLFLAGSDGDFVVIDVTNPRQPQLVGIFPSVAGLEPVDVAVSGGFAYVAGSFVAGLLIFDVTDPTAPVRLPPLPGDYLGLYAEGSLLYATESTDGLVVLDLSDPSSPAKIGALSGGPPGAAKDVSVEGGTAYLAWGFDLGVVDVNDPTQPILLSQLPLPGPAEDTRLDGSTLFVAATFEGVCAVDVSDPGAPMLLGTAQTPDYAQDLAVLGDHVLVADREGGMQILQDGNLRSVGEIASYRPAGFLPVLDVAGVGDLAVLLEGTRIETLDFPTETAPVPIGSAPTSSYRTLLRLDGGLAYLAGRGGMEVFDLADPTAPASIGVLDLPGYQRSMRLVNGHALLGANADGLQVVDVSDPASPELVTTLDVRALQVDVAGDLAFVAVGNGFSDAPYDLLVVDVQDPAAPLVVGRTSIGPGSRYVSPVGIAVEGDHAYVAFGNEGLKILDVSDPTRPFLEGDLGQPAVGVDDVRVEGDLAYLSTRDSFEIWDVSDPRAPVVLGGASVPVFGSSGGTNLRHLALSAERIYAALAGSDGIRTYPVECDLLVPRPGGATDVPAVTDAAPAGLSLAVAGRNPSSGVVPLLLSLSVSDRVVVTVHDAAGRRIRTLLRGVLPGGSRTLRWDGHDESGARATAGVYFVRASTTSGTVARKIVRIPE